jgi:glycogen debranching enzyme
VALIVDRPLTVGIRHPLILKANDLALVCREDGDIPTPEPGLGLLFRDTCYLGGYRFKVGHTSPLLLAACDEEGAAARLTLTNPDIKAANGLVIETHRIDIDRTLLIADEPPRFIDAIGMRNACETSVRIPVSIEFSTLFQDVFVLRGAHGLSRGELHAPAWNGHSLLFGYDGADHLRRTLTVEFSQPPAVGPCTGEHTAVFFQFDIGSGETETLTITMHVEEIAVGEGARAAIRSPIRSTAQPPLVAQQDRPATFARVECSDRETGRFIARSLADLALLGVQRGEERFTAAGLPWFLALFGRDSLIPAIQSLAFNPDLCADALRALAARQGRRDDPRTGEEDGKILHEWRVGEAANLGEVPQTPSYEAVDATPLFLMAIGRHAAWAGSLDLFGELRDAVDRAIAWMRRREAASPLGYIGYGGVTKEGKPVNQVWRDSSTGVLRADGAVPTPPLALVEVQGYAWSARRLVAPLLRRLGEDPEADRLDAEATALAGRFERDFWMEEEGCYCLALERGGAQVASITSNAAQVLWTGIAEAGRARRVADRVMRDDMYSGWGVRTLSSQHPRYDPLAYQQGSVWPFDNSLIAAGLRRYGLDTPAERIFQSMIEAARRFPQGRLPEFLGGNRRVEGGSPARIPRSDPLQAWSAGALPFMLSELLGLEPEGFDGRLIIRRPHLPADVDWLRIEGLRLGRAVLTVAFERKGGLTDVVAEITAGEAEVRVER